MTAVEHNTEWNLSVAKILSAFHDVKKLPKTMIDASCSLTGNTWRHLSHYTNDGRIHFLSAYPSKYVGSIDLDRQLWSVDPFFVAIHGGQRGLLHLREIMPEGFERTRFFEKVYGREGVVDELLHVIDIPDGTRVGIGIIRRGKQGVFLPAEVDLHRRAHAVFEAAAIQLGRMRSLAYESPEVVKDRSKDGLNVASQLEKFGSTILTPREQEVIRLVVRGHNSESIASTLGIAVYTVKMHRKNSYAKLKINSQGDLFNMFLESIGVARK